MYTTMKEYRESLGLSATKLAELLCITRQEIYRWERGLKPSDRYLHVLRSAGFPI